MCGIFGIITKENSDIETEKIKAVTDSLFKLSESRGKEAAGIAIKTKAGVSIFKKPTPASKMIKLKEYKDFIRQNINEKPLAIIGHSRLVTNGLQIIENNNQPVVKDDGVAVHNGIIVNVEELFKKFPEFKKQYEVDTEIILDLVQYFYKKSNSMVKAIQEMYKQIEGAASIALIFKNSSFLVLATNTGSLYTCEDREKKIIIFASEKYILNQLIKGGNPKNLLNPEDIHQIKPRTGKIIDINSLDVENFEFEIKQEYRAFQAKNIIENKLPTPEPKLKRCNKCVLPETFPYIKFDNDGVCNYCKNYQKQKTKGVEELEMILEKYRKKNGKPDCIVAFSGGRDSSYGLHYIKNVLKMNPIAFTYDWGMVTDLARRNQARICGKLGIEHILISADINKKRNNIKKNVLAWLKKPDLGTIPLFMAGDKQYFYYVNKLRKQLNIKLIVYSENPLEKTDFKSGFCGVEPKFNIKHVYNLGLKNKIKLGLYYLTEFIKNPSYINSSIIDTLWAYIASYFTAHEYLYLFQYIKWDENEINNTLINNYNWETAVDTKSTWRIGDGTAPFYNYIYYAVAGFTENDTFRSNQIREEVITREQALNFIKTENLPRYEGLRWYTDQIGIDLDKTLKIIDSVPKLYKQP
jgi:glucosamine--fructose-6-phosphate aminotransferase (isomerizing)